MKLMVHVGFVAYRIKAGDSRSSSIWVGAGSSSVVTLMAVEMAYFLRVLFMHHVMRSFLNEIFKVRESYTGRLTWCNGAVKLHEIQGRYNR